MSSIILFCGGPLNGLQREVERTPEIYRAARMMVLDKVPDPFDPVGLVIDIYERGIIKYLSYSGDTVVIPYIYKGME